MRKDTPEYVKELAKQLRIEQTQAEAILWERLRGSRFAGYKFKRQYALGRYIADFYCSEARLVIEIDGGIHNGTDQREYDTIRDTELKARGVNIIRINNEQVFENIESTLELIYRHLAV